MWENLVGQMLCFLKAYKTMQAVLHQKHSLIKHVHIYSNSLLLEWLKICTTCIMIWVSTEMSLYNTI